MLSLPTFYTEADRARIVGKIQAWTDLFSRHTLGAYNSRHRAQGEKATNRQKQLDDAQARYEAMDLRMFQVALALEAQNFKRKQHHKGHNMKPGPKVTVYQQSALGSVLAKNPDLADEYNLQVKANRGARGSLGQQERRTTSQQSRSGRSRSASFMSALSSASRHSSRKSSKTFGSPERPRSLPGKLAGRPREQPGVQVARSILVIHIMVQSQKTAKASLGAEAEAQAPSPTAREKPKVAAEDGSEAFYKRWQQTSF